MIHFLVAYLILGIFHVIAARNAIFDDNGLFTIVWAGAVVLLWPLVPIFRLAGHFVRGDL